jgi:hypothetical protein
MDPEPDLDSDPGPAIFVIDIQHASKKLIFNTIFSAYYFLKVHLHHFSKIKCQKESPNIRNQGFSYYFCMMIEGSGSGSIPLTSGSGSWRPKNMWIRNTAQNKTAVFTKQIPQRLDFLAKQLIGFYRVMTRNPHPISQKTTCKE